VPGARPKEGEVFGRVETRHSPSSGRVRLRLRLRLTLRLRSRLRDEALAAARRLDEERRRPSRWRAPLARRAGAARAGLPAALAAALAAARPSARAPRRAHLGGAVARIGGGGGGGLCAGALGRGDREGLGRG